MFHIEQFKEGVMVLIVIALGIIFCLVLLSLAVGQVKKDAEELEDLMNDDVFGEWKDCDKDGRHE